MIKLPKGKMGFPGPDDLSLMVEGKHLVEIVAAKTDDKSGALMLACKALAGPKGTAVNGLLIERFHLSDAALPRFEALLKRLDLLDRGAHIDDGWEFDEQWLVGQRLVAEIINESFDTKAGRSVTASRFGAHDGKGMFAFWSVTDPRVAEFVAGVDAPPTTNGNGRSSTTTDIDPEAF